MLGAFVGAFHVLHSGEVWFRGFVFDTLRNEMSLVPGSGARVAGLSNPVIGYNIACACFLVHTMHPSKRTSVCGEHSQALSSSMVSQSASHSMPVDVQ